LRRICIIFVLILESEHFLSAASLWRDRNIYKSGESIKVGDVITVRIDDLTNLQFSMNSNSRTSSDIASNPDVNITAFLPKISSDKKSTSQDKTELSSKGRLTLDIAAQITNRANDGTFAIRGLKEYTFSGVANRFEVSGSVDPALVNGRTVRSGDIVNFRLNISTAKQGLNINIQRPALTPDQTPKAELTNDEKQKIIIDYISKMLGELTR
jgi:flagellar basal body L-ring protein FlgH